MPVRSSRRSVAAAAALALVPAAAAAGVTDGRALPQGGSHALQCWQNGVKIIDEKGLGALAATPPHDAKALTFAADRRGSSVLVILDGNTACLVRRTS